MWGAIIATIIGGAIYLFGDNVAPESAFLGGTNFLFYWYLVLGIIGMVFGLLIALGIMGTGTIVGGSKWGIAGGLLGAVGGGTLGLFVLALIFVTSAMRVAGAYLLHDSVALIEGGVYEWEIAKVVIGGLLVGLPLLFRSSSSSSSSSS